MIIFNALRLSTLVFLRIILVMIPGKRKKGAICSGSYWHGLNRNTWHKTNRIIHR